MAFAWLDAERRQFGREIQQFQRAIQLRLAARAGQQQPAFDPSLRIHHLIGEQFQQRDVGQQQIDLAGQRAVRFQRRCQLHAGAQMAVLRDARVQLQLGAVRIQRQVQIQIGQVQQFAFGGRVQLQRGLRHARLETSLEPTLRITLELPVGGEAAAQCGGLFQQRGQQRIQFSQVETVQFHGALAGRPLRGDFRAQPSRGGIQAGARERYAAGIRQIHQPGRLAQAPGSAFLRLQMQIAQFSLPTAVARLQATVQVQPQRCDVTDQRQAEVMCGAAAFAGQRQCREVLPTQLQRLRFDADAAAFPGLHAGPQAQLLRRLPGQGQTLAIQLRRQAGRITCATQGQAAVQPAAGFGQQVGQFQRRQCQLDIEFILPMALSMDMRLAQTQVEFTTAVPIGLHPCLGRAADAAPAQLAVQPIQPQFAERAGIGKSTIQMQPGIQHAGQIRREIRGVKLLQRGVQRGMQCRRPGHTAMCIQPATGQFGVQAFQIQRLRGTATSQLHTRLIRATRKTSVQCQRVVVQRTIDAGRALAAHHGIRRSAGQHDVLPCQIGMQLRIGGGKVQFAFEPGAAVIQTQRQRFQPQPELVVGNPRRRQLQHEAGLFQPARQGRLAQVAFSGQLQCQRLAFKPQTRQRQMRRIQIQCPVRFGQATTGLQPQRRRLSEIGIQLQRQRIQVAVDAQFQRQRLGMFERDARLGAQAAGPVGGDIDIRIQRQPDAIAGQRPLLQLQAPGLQ